MQNSEGYNSSSQSQRQGEKSFVAKRAVQNPIDENDSRLSNLFVNKVVHKVGHDLRSPIFVIRSYSQLLQKSDDPTRRERGMKMIEQASYKAENIIDSLIGLIDIYTKPVPKEELLLIEDVVNKAINQLSNEIDRINPEIIYNFKSYPVIRFSPEYLLVLVYELIKNALHHNMDNPNLKIQISTYKIDGKHTLEVKDNGCFVTEGNSFLDLKDPFFKDSENEINVGIGLSKAEAIAKVFKCKLILEKGKEGGFVCKFEF